MAHGSIVYSYLYWDNVVVLYYLTVNQWVCYTKLNRVWTYCIVLYEGNERNYSKFFFPIWCQNCDILNEKTRVLEASDDKKKYIKYVSTYVWTIMFDPMC